MGDPRRERMMTCPKLSRDGDHPCVSDKLVLHPVKDDGEVQGKERHTSHGGGFVGYWGLQGTKKIA